MTSDEAWTELQTEQNDPECSFEICRLCMGTESLENLFEGDGLQRWITDYLSIVVSSEDSISHAICTICRIQLDEFHQFRIRCMEVQTALWSMAQTEKIVESPKQSRPSCGSRQQRNMPIDGVLEKGGQYHCGTCGKVFDDRKRVLDHMRIHGPKKHLCMKCGQSFPIRLHLKSHTCDELEEEPIQKEHEVFDLQAVKIEPREEIDSIAESPGSEHPLERETVFEEEGSSYAEEQEESRTVNHIEDATADRIEIGLVKIEEPADDEMEESAVSEIAEFESNADQRDVPFELGLENAETATSRSNDSMHSEMEEVCEVPKDNVISEETNVRRQGSVKANSEVDDSHVSGQQEGKTEKPNHRCGQCLKVFSTSQKLKDHMRMVHGEKKYACHICDKRFVLPNNLRVHARSHNEDTPFKCNVCEKTFKYEQSVWQHKKTQHVSQNSCVDCGIDFPARRQYEQHLRTILHRINAEMRGNSQNERVSDESGSNGTTDETLQRMDEIEKVEEAQPETAETAQQQQQKHHQCDNCPKKFLEKRQLKTHKRFTHGEKKFVCPVCSKGYIAACYLRVHMRVHDPAKSFKCTKCEKWYKDKRALAFHERTKHSSVDFLQMLRNATKFDNGRSASAPTEKL